MRKPLAIATALGGTALVMIGLLLFFSPQEQIKPSLKQQTQETEDQFVNEHLSNLSTEDKVRQLFIWTVTGPNVSDDEFAKVEALKPGGVMISGSMNHTELLRLTVRLRSLKTSVPMIIAIDQEGGQVKRFSDDTLGAGNTLGEATDTQFCDSIKDSSRWLSELGINLNFGIIADIAWTPESYMYDRSYGSEPAGVSRHVTEAIHCTVGVMTTVKHFPGHGRALQDSHFVIPSISLSYDEWKKTDAEPFRVAVQNHVDAIMMGHLLYPDIASDPASLSPRFVKEVRDMGFNGLVITDDMGMLEASGLPPADSMKRAMTAGNDMLLYASTQAQPEDLVKQGVDCVKQNGVSEKDLNEHVKRILRAKYGL